MNASTGQSSPPPSGTRRKIVLVGLGRMGRNHLRVIRESPQFELVAVVDPQASVSESRDLGGVKLVRALDEVGSVEFESAVVATPTATHYEVTKTLLAAGKHVLLEKPIAPSYAESRELIELARSRGLLLAVGHVERFNPAVRKLREVIREGWLGTPIHFSFTRVGGYPETVAGNNNVILDLAVHDIDVLRSLIGPVRLEGSIGHSTMREGVFDTAELFFSGPSGASAAAHVNWITPTKIRTIRVTGTRGVCFVDYILQTCELLGGNLLRANVVQSAGFERLQELYRNSDRIEFGVAKEEPLKAQLGQFHALITSGDPGELCLGPDALAAVMLVERAIAHEYGRVKPGAGAPIQRDALPREDDVWL
jgi:UDP-N-acetylglucosamine 3-dehydrogenase